jgi:zinc/manganese transport system ATP-binding protein
MDGTEHLRNRGRSKVVTSSNEAVLQVKNASLGFAEKSVWSNLDLSVNPGEFIAVIGANASGKTVLLKAILGQLALTSGSIELFGEPVRHGSREVGYIPQHRQADSGLPLRAGDLLRMGLDGHRFGLPLPSSKTNKRIAEVLEMVGASDG